MIFLKKWARILLTHIPIIRGIYHRIDTARLETSIALRERDLAVAEKNSIAAERDNLIAERETMISIPPEYRHVSLFAPPGHFYSPIVDPRQAAKFLKRTSTTSSVKSLPGINLDGSEMRSFWQSLLPFLLTCPFEESAREGFRYYYENPAYSFGDASVLHAILRLLKPKRVIEVGSGWSSACIVDTIEHFFEGQCELTFIEPYPQLLKELIGVTKAGVRILPHRVQDTPLSVFSELEAGDILFIDSTHILATGSDVCYELFEVLPLLKAGVVVHFHDMFWPFEYSALWAVDQNRSWNELYGIRAMLMNNTNWQILFFNDYFAKNENELIMSTFPLFAKNSGGGLWLVKR